MNKEFCSPTLVQITNNMVFLLPENLSNRAGPKHMSVV